MDVEYKAVRLLDTKGDDAAGSFSGYGAVFHNVDAQGDAIQPGAFASSLTEWQGRGKLPPMLLQHGGGLFGGGADDMLPIGRWTAMQENARGLKVDGQLFALGTERGQYIYEGLKSGVLDGLSIGFKTRDSRPGPAKGPERILTDLELWEVSVVTFPANPQARVTAVKALTLDTLRGLERYLHEDLEERGFTKVEAKRVIAAIRTYLQRDVGEPEQPRRDVGTDPEVAEVLARLTERTDSLWAESVRQVQSRFLRGERVP